MLIEDWLIPLASVALVGAALALLPLWVACVEGRRFLTVYRWPQRKASSGAGGLALALLWAGVLLYFLPTLINPRFGLAALALIVLVGVMDTRRALSPPLQLVAQLAIALLLVRGGASAPFVTNPQGGILYLDWWQAGGWVLPADLLAVGWMLALVNAFNFFDGVDGLAGNVAVIALVVLALLSATAPLADAPVALAAAFMAGGTLAFVFFNWRGEVVLGTAGSWLLGFTLATLSLAASTKIATAALVLALPLADAVGVILRRLRAGKLPWQGGHDHLHHFLVRAGFPLPHLVLAATSLSALAGIFALIFTTKSKLTAIIVLSLFIALLGLLFSHPWRLREKKKAAEAAN
jgi:UDP-GlcNAc:undecaprenyl-phosphate GlcNAc-1-phosphate transferase